MGSPLWLDQVRQALLGLGRGQPLGHRLPARGRPRIHALLSTAVRVSTDGSAPRPHGPVGHDRHRAQHVPLVQAGQGGRAARGEVQGVRGVSTVEEQGPGVPGSDPHPRVGGGQLGFLSIWRLRLSSDGRQT